MSARSMNEPAEQKGSSAPTHEAATGTAGLLPTRLPEVVTPGAVVPRDPDGVWSLQPDQPITKAQVQETARLLGVGELKTFKYFSVHPVDIRWTTGRVQVELPVSAIGEIYDYDRVAEINLRFMYADDSSCSMTFSEDWMSVRADRVGSYARNRKSAVQSYLSGLDLVRRPSRVFNLCAVMLGELLFLCALWQSLSNSAFAVPLLVGGICIWGGLCLYCWLVVREKRRRGWLVDERKRKSLMSSPSFWMGLIGVGGIVATLLSAMVPIWLGVKS